MPPIETGITRAVGALETRIARPAGKVPAGPAPVQAGPAPATSAAPAVTRSEALQAGEMPVDGDRVELIRKAVERGTYPVVPARIVDAMIAAGLLLRTAQ
ncbi:MAG: flagellar biosynthesis anti-sigma factor FlgM [Novosphingobium sp.]